MNDFKDSDCYVGVDLGVVSDLTAVSYLVVKDNKYYFKTHYYLPESALTDKAGKEQYKQWRINKELTVTAGNTTDYDWITNDLMMYSEIVNIQAIGYDKYNSTQWAIDATAKGLPLEPYSQSLANFNKPTKEIERLILSGRAVIDNNEINRFCFKNIVLKSDHNGNVKPVKQIDKNKIDGVITMIQSLGMYLEIPHYTNELTI